VQALLARVQTAGARSAWLDATAAGAPLYERFGFRKMQPSLRYAGTLPPGQDLSYLQDGAPAPRPMRAADLEQVCALDRQWWGADRGWFLRRRFMLHPDLCYVLPDGADRHAIAGYLMARRRVGRLWIGPWCVAEEVERPEALLAALASDGQAVPFHAGALAGSARARQAFVRLGWVPSDDAPWRMLWGAPCALAQRPEVLANGTSAKG
jgi:hypothetical protein